MNGVAYVMKQNNEKFNYIEVFILFSSVIEHWLKRVIIVILLTVVIIQLLLQSIEIRYYLTTIDKLEGIVNESTYRE